MDMATLCKHSSPKLLMCYATVLKRVQITETNLEGVFPSHNVGQLVKWARIYQGLRRHP